MADHEKYMRRCLELAEKGAGRVAPNPMVGCVIVRNDVIIAEGYHMQYGGPHAEVNAIRHVADERALRESTLYVNLEPCAHFGKTPPCADLILEKKIPYVVIGCMDPNPQVQGKGIHRLLQNGVDVKVGVLEKEAQFLNRRFFTGIREQRPYIVLKWAQSADGFIDHNRDQNNGERAIVSSPEAHLLVHKWRSEEAAIMVGTNTVISDDPQLTVRLTEGPNPVRVTFDRRNRIPHEAKILDGTSPTIIFTEGAHYTTERAEFIPIDFSAHPLRQALAILHEKKLLSVLVEGGTAILNKFFEENLWDEVRVLVSPKEFGGGVKAPVFPVTDFSTENVGPDKLYRFYNRDAD
ncbi:MAG TPA: bifunctional diaminohydroxyphosphoribosylaminopyrimidine deaminase/5-amino-6-(5-phosphoribosylamino)uracil reductase RibD [Bacteroidia bacterium]|nr:bifunctional diaminohydroxyphosphoribosylaminopyrimidine deaminase/5-amino-6-(5-phosphoribosylamino)uracil reductase RibD [Bacteroidia bacterium]